jgi:hypothetical protein
MKPLSPGHWLLLHHFDIAFITGQEVTLGDLLLALLICSQSYEDIARDGMEANRLEKAMRQWQNKLAGGWRGKVRRRIKKARGEIIRPSEYLGFEFGPEVALFSNYLRDQGAFAPQSDANQWAWPLTARTKELEDDNEINTPEPFLLVAAAMGDLGMSLRIALNSSLALLRWLLAANQERKGGIVVKDLDEEIEEQEEANRYAKEVASGRMV